MSARKLTPEDKERLLAVIATGVSQVEAAKALGINANVLSHSICADPSLREAVRAAKLKAPPVAKPPRPERPPAPERERVEHDTRSFVSDELAARMRASLQATLVADFERAGGKGRPRFRVSADYCSQVRPALHSSPSAAERDANFLQGLSELDARASDEAGLAWNRTG
jgi:transposase-like protein